MTIRKSWTIAILLTLSLITLLIAPITVWYNLKHYSVYYAHHVNKNEDKHPEIIFIVNNIGTIILPSDKQITYNIYNKQIKFLVQDKHKSKEEYLVLEPDWTIENLDGYMISLENNTSYHWDYRGKFLYHYSYLDDRKTIDENINDEAQQLLLKTIYPIIDVQKEPKLNLQWLFNLIYQRQFE